MATTAVCLNIDDFNDVYMSCDSVKASWYILATYLKVHRPTVQAIESKGLDPAKCLHEVLTAWLRVTPKQPKPSWRSLCDALAGMGEVALSERMQREYPCGCGLCKADVRQTAVSNAVQRKDAKTAATELMELFDELLDFLNTEIHHVNVHKLRLHITKFFKKEEEINEEIERHLSRIEDYSTSEAVLNYFIRHDFVGYINYSLVKVFQAIAKSPLLDKRIEEYEKDYQRFLELTLVEIHKVHEQCPDLCPKYPAGIPKFTIHLESEWDGKSVYELKDFLKECFNNSDCIDQLMIAKISRNCIIVTFAVLPHIARTILQYLTNDDVISTLKKEGITVDISKQLMKYKQKTTEEKGTMTTDSITTEIPSESGVEQNFQDQPTLAGMLSLMIKPGQDVTSSDSGYVGSIGDTEGAGDQRLIDELREDVSLKEAVDAYEYWNRLKRQIKALEVQLQKHKIMVFELDQTKDELQNTKLSLTQVLKKMESKLRVQPRGVSRDKLNDELMSVECVKTLIDSGADISASNNKGETPLHIASDHGHVELVKLLISRGAIVDVFSNYRGRTPLHYASSKGHTAVVQVLLSHGATVDIVNDRGETPLYLAANNGHAETVDCLISHGAGVDKQDKWGQSPLYRASWNARNSRDNVATVTILLSHGATVDIKNNEGNTPLYIASGNSDSDIVNILLSHGATVDIKDNTGCTPLHRAAINSRDHIVDILLSHGATVNAVDENLQTPLHRCLLQSSHHSRDIGATVGLLISNGADLCQEDKYNQSPVLIGTVLGQEGLLLSHGVSEDTIAKYRLPQEWTAKCDLCKLGIEYTNTATGSKQDIHPLFQ